jgi:tetratricopeptide (TPR) repeat protein
MAQVGGSPLAGYIMPCYDNPFAVTASKQKSMDMPTFPHVFWSGLAVLLLAAVLAPPLRAQDGPPPPEIFEFATEPSPDPARTNRSRGLQAISEGVYGMAVTFFQNYLRETNGREPDFSEASALLAEAYLALGRLSEAEKVLIEHGARTSGAGDALLQARIVYVWSQVCFKQGKWEECLKRSWPLTQPEAPPPVQAKAVILYVDAAARIPDWAGAIKVMTEYLARSSAGAETYQIQRRLVSAYLITGQLDAAKDMLDMIRTVDDPALALSFDLLRLLCLSLQGDLSGAAVVFQRLSRQCPTVPNPEWWEALWQFAEALFRAEKYAEAAAVLPLALQVATDDAGKVRGLVRLADTCIRLNNVNQAKDTLEEIRRSFPDSQELVQVTTRLAQLQQQMGNHLSAAELYAELVAHPKVGPDLRYQAWTNRARSLVRAGQWQKAVEAFLAGEKAGATALEQSQAVFEAAETADQAQDKKKAAELYGRVASQYAVTALAPEARLRQGAALMAIGEYQAAVTAYESFVTAFPANPQIETAMLWQGVAMRQAARSAADSLRAVEFLVSLARASDREDLAVSAFLEAFQAADAAGELDLAAEQLSAVINGFPSSEQLSQALYQRVVIRFRQGRLADARQDAESFLNSFPLLPQAADICILMGDSLAAESKWEEAKKYYLWLVTTQASSPLVPVALYEAAFAARQLQQHDGALALLEQLQGALKLSAANGQEGAKADRAVPPDYPAKAEMLRGDILSQQGKYAEARLSFASARTLAGDIELGYAALGRQGEMLMALAEANPALLTEAEQCFGIILAAENASAPLREMATYRLAKCLERRGRTQEALDQYLKMYFAYTSAEAETPPRSWVYFSRCVYDAARILETTGETESLRQAARLYEGLAKAGLPVSAEAARRAEDIRAAHRLAQ